MEYWPPLSAALRCWLRHQQAPSVAVGTVAEAEVTSEAEDFTAVAAVDSAAVAAALEVVAGSMVVQLVALALWDAITDVAVKVIAAATDTAGAQPGAIIGATVAVTTAASMAILLAIPALGTMAMVITEIRIQAVPRTAAD
ncbi:MAG: hypothetical protein JWO15_955 [Sphingomonadales bacterium]|nr:hypothetical protein [Sphingomonadales bacterium]